MALSRWLATAAASSTLLLDAQHKGNPICWDTPNLENVVLSFELCCSGLPEVEEACFDGLSGAYSWDFCCSPPVEDLEMCEWESTIRSGPPDLQPYPLVVRSEVCAFPGFWKDWWATSQSKIPVGYVFCCLPSLVRRLGIGDLEDPPWITAEVDRMLLPLHGRRWSVQEFDAFEAAVLARPWPDSGIRPCRVKVRNGQDVSMCQLDMSCQTDGHDTRNDCSYVRTVVEALQIVAKIKPLPDMDLFVSPGERDYGPTAVPVFTRHRPRAEADISNYLLLPVEWQLHSHQMRKQIREVLRIGMKVDWNHRTSALRWRGTNSNCFFSCHLKDAAEGAVSWSACLAALHCSTYNLSNWLETPRGRLIFLSQFVSGLNARWTGIAQPMDAELWRYLVEVNLTAAYESFGEQDLPKYVIDIMGHSDADQKYWQFLSGSTVLLHENPWTSWLVGSLFKPFEHFVPVRFDLSNLAERLEWLRTHDDEAQRIKGAAHRLASRYLTYDGILLYVRRLVERYAADHLQHPWPSV